MTTEPKKTYIQTPSKIQFLWNLANKLIGDYDDFNKRMNLLEEKVNKITYNNSLKNTSS